MFLQIVYLHNKRVNRENGDVLRYLLAQTRNGRNSVITALKCGRSSSVKAENKEFDAW